MGYKQKKIKKRNKTARSGVWTHADICLLKLKSNALTTRPSWLIKIIKIYKIEWAKKVKDQIF